MEEEFYATIKLLSGEELVSKVCYLPDEDCILQQNPMEVECAKRRKGNFEVTGFQLKEWVSASFDDQFIIKKDHVITISELDNQIQEFYEQSISRLESSRNLGRKGNKLPRGSGYLGSVKEMKKSLEEIYKRS